MIDFNFNVNLKFLLKFWISVNVFFLVWYAIQCHCCFWRGPDVINPCSEFHKNRLIFTQSPLDKQRANERRTRFQRNFCQYWAWDEEIFENICFFFYTLKEMMVRITSHDYINDIFFFYSRKINQTASSFISKLLWKKGRKKERTVLYREKKSPNE